MGGNDDVYSNAAVGMPFLIILINSYQNVSIIVVVVVVVVVVSVVIVLAYLQPS